MNASKTQHIHQAEVRCQAPNQAVKGLSEALYQDNMAGALFFCSDSYDPDILTGALKARFNCPIVGCTTAGEIGSSYQKGGIVGISFSADHFHSTLINKLDKAKSIGNEWYIRSVQKVNADGSLTFYCAIDEGLPLTIAKGVGFVPALTNKTTKLNHPFSKITCTIGFDCILQKVELLESLHKEEVENKLRALNFISFSTFGEQIDAIHVNQTLTGVVIGEH